jgi:benzoyl-CoA-dihydrodiol lyase
MTQVIDFRTDPVKYRHWRVNNHGDVANLIMDVDETAGLFEGYDLKLNSYDLGVDIELNDIVQRMRFEHPEVKVVVMQSGKDKVFSAGANIRMLGAASHSHKVNFCKFTNETRNAYEAAEADSGQKYIAAIKGACAGGGYELALACNYIMLTDDSSSAVGLPEVPLLAVLPGTGGLTRITDKRKMRRDLADIFCSIEEGVKGKRAKDWRLVDEVIANSKFDQTVQGRALEFAAASDKAGASQGIALGPLERQITDDGIAYEHINVTLDRSHRRAEITLKGPTTPAPADMAQLQAQGDQAYLLKLCRELEDAILHLRFNEMDLGLWVFKSQGDGAAFLAHEAVIATSDHWLAVEIRHYWKRTLKRIDVTSRSLAAFVENGSCFVGLLSEILFAVDRTYMMEGEFEDDERAEAEICLSSANFGGFPMGNDFDAIANAVFGRAGTGCAGAGNDRRATRRRAGRCLGSGDHDP